MSKRRGRPPKLSHRRPTLSQQNKEIKDELQALFKKRSELIKNLKGKSKQPIESVIKKLNNILKQNNEVRRELSENITSVMNMQEQTLKDLKTELDTERTTCEKIEKIIQYCRRGEQCCKTCSVCFSKTDYSGDHCIVSLPCGHIYGKSCINYWLGLHMECPQCRHPTQYDEVRQLSFQWSAK